MIMEQPPPSYQNLETLGSDNDGRTSTSYPSTRSCDCPSSSLRRLILGAILIASIIFVIVDSSSLLATNYISSGFRTLLEWIEGHPVSGIFAFVGVYILATIACVPGSILTLGAGFVFGKAVGLGPGVALATVAVFVGASLGAVASFLLARYLLRDWVERTFVQKYPAVKAMDAAFRHEGYRIFLLIRLSPIFPFDAMNYIGGVTSMKLRHYLLALFGMLPGTLLYCFVGASAGSLAESQNFANRPVAIASIIVGIAFGVLAVFTMSYYAKKEIDKIVVLEEGHGCEQEGFTAELSVGERIPSHNSGNLDRE